MVNKELRKLSRTELLKMLLEQSKEVENLKQELEISQEKLKSRKLEVKQAGSIADAALQVNKVFETAQKAADQYLENIQQINSRQTDICSKLIADAESRCKEMEDQTKEKCESMVKKARFESQQYWDNVNKKLELFINQHKELREILNTTLPRE